MESHHNASESVETFHTSSNHCLEVKKLSLGQWWCTGQRVLEFTYGSNILSLSFMWLNSWKFENWIEIAWNSSQMTEWVVIAERTKFRILSMHFTAFAQSARFHLYGFQGPSLWYFVDLKCHLIASESLETFHTSPHHCLDVKKFSLGRWWCTGLRFLEFPYASNIVPLSFMWLNSWMFENCIEIAWNFLRISESVFVAEKT